MGPALMEAVERLQKAITESEVADVQRDDVMLSGDVVAVAKASGAAEGECANLRRKAQVLVDLLKARGA